MNQSATFEIRLLRVVFFTAAIIALSLSHMADKQLGYIAQAPGRVLTLINKIRQGRSHAPTAPRLSAEQLEAQEIGMFPGCDVLNLRINTDHYHEVTKCFNSLSQFLGAERNLAMQKALSFKSSKLRNFVAYVFTAMGESVPGASRLDQMAIMKVLENRGKALESGMGKADLLLAAFWPNQFSMYNAKLYDKNPVFGKTTKDYRARSALRAFITYQTAKFAPVWDDVFFYRSSKLKKAPAWEGRNGVTPVEFDHLTINGQAISMSGEHIFSVDPKRWAERATDTDMELSDDLAEVRVSMLEDGDSFVN